MTSKVAVYVRVSTLDQEKGIQSQEHAIREYLAGHGIEGATWYRDKLSGKDLNRPGFEQLQKEIFKGTVKTVVCWKLDRISRSLKDGVNVLHDWLSKDVRVIAIHQQMDFSGAMGQLVAALLLAIAQWERENLRENTKRGIQNAKAKGVRFQGRRPTLHAKDIVPLLLQNLPMSEIARRLGHSRPAIYAALKREHIEITQVRNGCHAPTES